jgi:AcrR family transcriptional regulator
MRESTRARIVRSAIKIARDSGIMKLTIADVADEASVSKGGLLYHFATKDNLIYGVLKDTVEQYADELARLQANDRKPGGWMRALLTSTFPPPKQQIGDIVVALFSTLLLADRPVGKEMLSVYQSNLLKWTELVASDGLDELTAAVIQMAIDGLMFNEAVGARPFPPALRRRFLERLCEMTHVDTPVAERVTELVET